MRRRCGILTFTWIALVGCMGTKDRGGGGAGSAAGGDPAARPARDGRPPSRPPGRPEGPPEIVAVYATTVDDPTPRPLMCRHVGGIGGTLDALAPAACPATGFRPATVSVRALLAPALTLHVVLDELLGDANGPPCASARCPLFERRAGLLCGDDELALAASTAPAANPVGRELLLEPRGGVTLAAGTRCTLHFAADLVDATGDPIPTEGRWVPLTLSE
ncbi:MAG: hypothetical protein JNK64_33545 [Myxococcales bacterium]|nr:hypothetical protein [Myxococcales bacterium]